MSALTEEIQRLAKDLCLDEDPAPLVDIKVDMREGAGDWFHVVVWDGQYTKVPAYDEGDFEYDVPLGLGILATASALGFEEALTAVRDVLKARAG